MTMFRIKTYAGENGEVEAEFDFMAMEFAVANAAFAALASNGLNADVHLLIVEGNNVRLIADMPMFKEAERQRRMPSMMQPGAPPNFRA